jgi:hypothetical protein
MEMLGISVKYHAVQRYRSRVRDCVDAEDRIRRDLGGVSLSMFGSDAKFRLHRDGVTYVLAKEGSVIHVITVHLDDEAKRLPGYYGYKPKVDFIKSRRSSAKYRMERSRC